MCEDFKKSINLDKGNNQIKLIINKLFLIILTLLIK
jgi:hypothetical protein